MAGTLATVREIRHLQRADGSATVLAIGTANPPNCVPQDEYPEYYFRVTKSEHLTDLKRKLKTLCKHGAWISFKTLLMSSVCTAFELISLDLINVCLLLRSEYGHGEALLSPH
jgi:hypothetical protein